MTSASLTGEDLLSAVSEQASASPSAAAPGQTDLLLVEQVQAGNRHAFDLLVLRHQHRVAALVSRYTRQRQDIADITQDTFIRAYRALPGFRGDSEFYTWLYRIAVNVAKSHLATAGRRPLHHSLDDAENAWPEQPQDLATPAAVHEGSEMIRVVRQAWEALPDDLREALRLREFEGLSYDEIAATMQTPVGTVRSRIFRAREAIDRRLQSWRAGEQLEW